MRYGLSSLFQFNYCAIKSIVKIYAGPPAHHFNSIIVRLKASSRVFPNPQWVNFNSIIVRLKELPLSLFVIRSVKFQFNYCAIKSNFLWVFQYFQLYFNSIIVRLKGLIILAASKDVSIFQFNYCAIKRTIESPEYPETYIFQFNYCAIKSEIKLLQEKIERYFNSIIVRLKGF